MENKNEHKKLQKLANERADIYLSKYFKALIDEAEAHVEQICPKDLYILDDKMILIDVREPEEYASGYINAHNNLTIPRGKLEFMAIKKIADVYGEDAHIVTYCLKGPRGSLAAYQLKKMGFTNVRNLKGGILNWLDKGNTIHSYLGEMTLVK
ncbi:Rhodanese domain protein [hydrothermal vent metagenome]|uniref:Rhodanese domain protein n=1 Tax=hydrothermal vent metagenome TaxID=652676 RepID=A0A1W1ELE5_9ZZZZ